MSGLGNDKNEQFLPQKPSGVGYTRHNHTQTQAFLITQGQLQSRSSFQSISRKVILVMRVTFSNESVSRDRNQTSKPEHGAQTQHRGRTGGGGAHVLSLGKRGPPTPTAGAGTERGWARRVCCTGDLSTSVWEPRVATAFKCLNNFFMVKFRAAFEARQKAIKTL